MINHAYYTYRVTWSQDDGEHVALCTEFPSLSFLGDKPAKALQGMVNLVKDVVEDIAGNGETIPESIAGKIFSGKFQVRIPPEQHKSCRTG